jgi:23S rRNA pseudouridine1911/1915/1917 synthase
MSKKKDLIIFEDQDILIVNKPFDLLTIPDRWDPTKPNLVGMLQDLTKEKVYIVHRLDKGTSGVIIFAKNPEAHKILSQQMENRSATKFYHALVQGRVMEKNGLVDKPIAESKVNPGKMVVSKSGKPSQTKYQVIEEFRGYTYVECEILTGRTHQIRVHMASQGHPLAVDPMYGGAEDLKLSQFKKKYKHTGDEDEKPIMGRLTLHAGKVSFLHPVTDELVTFFAPLPKDFEALLTQLRKWG